MASGPFEGGASRRTRLSEHHAERSIQKGHFDGSDPFLANPIQGRGEDRGAYLVLCLFFLFFFLRLCVAIFLSFLLRPQGTLATP